MSRRQSSPRRNRGNDTERAEESEVGYETEDFQVLESQLVIEDLPNPILSAKNIIDSELQLDESKKTDVLWNARTSFTADSPYFDAFVSSEMQSFNVLSETLNGIVIHTRAFVKQGAIMSDVARKLSLACKLRSPDYSDDDSSDNDIAATLEEDLIQQRRNAVGEEMAGILDLLGEVR
jgi:hypothetical protein